MCGAFWDIELNSAGVEQAEEVKAKFLGLADPEGGETRAEFRERVREAIGTHCTLKLMKP